MENKNIETGYCHLRSKEVVNTKDGKRLGRVTDVIFTFPEGKVLGVVVSGGKLFQPGVFIDLRSITKIGEDVVLVEVETLSKPKSCKRGCSSNDSYYSTVTKRSFEEEE